MSHSHLIVNFKYPYFTFQEYSNWETDEVITRELFRNLGIALACVFVTTLILLADILGAVLVLLTVALRYTFYLYIVIHWHCQNTQ